MSMNTQKHATCTCQFKFECKSNVQHIYIYIHIIYTYNIYMYIYFIYLIIYYYVHIYIYTRTYQSPKHGPSQGYSSWAPSIQRVLELSAPLVACSSALCFCKLEVLLGGVSIRRALPVVFYVKAPEFWKLPSQVGMPRQSPTHKEGGMRRLKRLRASDTGFGAVYSD